MKRQRNQRKQRKHKVQKILAWFIAVVMVTEFWTEGSIVRAMEKETGTLFEEETITSQTDPFSTYAIVSPISNGLYDTQSALYATIAKMEVLPSADQVTAKDFSMIMAARIAYNSLTDEQKALVSASTLQKLTDAETAIENIRKQSQNSDVSENATSTSNSDGSDGSTSSASAANSASAARSVGSKSTRKGKVFTSGKGIYKITKESSDQTTAGAVAYQRPVKKKYAKVVIPSTVGFKGVTYSVTSVAAKAFRGCRKLKIIKIKTTVLKKIGKKAFAGVPKRGTVKVPKKKLHAYKKLLKKAAYKGKVKAK